MHGDPLSITERAIIDTAISLTSGRGVQRLCDSVLNAVERMYDARSSWILLEDHESPDQLITAAHRGPGGHAYADVRVPRETGMVGLVFGQREPVFVPDVASEDRWYDVDRVRGAHLQSVLLVPVRCGDSSLGVLGLDSPQFSAEAPPKPAAIARLQAIAAQAAVAIRNARLVESIEQDRLRLRRLLQERRQLRQEVVQLRDSMRESQALSATIGESAGWKAVLEQVQLVAPADSTVLLIGETGTGKELIAHAIHEQGRRRRHPFVAVNCAAFPESLVESELFGHERGAFTGAFERKPGKFELADRGTLFLDEIGELPAGVQAKLLRVLQEREITRIGGTKPIAVNVRLVAATNRDLQEALRNGSFRQDLYYRLSVFPVMLPPLRQRADDIPILARYFVLRFAERQGRPRPHLTPAAMRALQDYPWPGNVRELQNVLERAVILARSGQITPEELALDATEDVALGSSSESPGAGDASPAPEPLRESGSRVVSFSEAERRAILRALEMTGWRISGRGGAADVLGLKPTTLHAKMKRLGIHRPSVGAATPA